MNETNCVKKNISEKEKPVSASNPDIEDSVFPPFPDPTADDFDEDIPLVEREYYKVKFPDLNAIRGHKLHCTACDRHLGCAARNEPRIRVHPMLRTLMCQSCHTFYNSGEFDKGEDGSELYCRWCGQGGQVYCCSDCPHVFCAKCIRRNLGASKIKEIENTDDWKCFKCMPSCLWDLRAICWALLRYCDLKNKITFKTEDERLKEEYEKDCAIDHTTCCKNRRSRKEKDTPKKKEDKDLVLKESIKKKEEKDKDPIKKRDEKDATKKKEQDKKDELAAKPDTTASVISKIPSTIQVKKFASISNEDNKNDKRPQKRSLSPKNKNIIKNAVPIQPFVPKFYPGVPTAPKKLRMMSPATITPIRIAPAPQAYGVNRYRQRHSAPAPNYMPFNGFGSNHFTNYINRDNINLSLDSLTQGLDMSSINQDHSDDIVCMPDLPLEPLCEVTEDNDDDVECITPISSVPKVQVPSVVPKIIQKHQVLPDISPENIIQMTEDDVTVNASTGGLKFRVDPQTLSNNKMYRLPDGRIFAINPNPNMPGGYSATIVAVTDSSKTPSRGTMYAAKLNPISNPQPKSVTPKAKPRSRKTHSTPNTPNTAASTPNLIRECDMIVPVEWFRYNLIDAIDALSYSTSRLNKLKKESTTGFLRSRTIPEMKKLHKTLDRLLNTSAVRFMEIKKQLNKEMKTYVEKKMGKYVESDDNDDDDDDVEILPNNEEPISIDENSSDSVNNDAQVDLTNAGSDQSNCRERENSLSFVNNESTAIDNVVIENQDEPSKSITQELENETAGEDISSNGDKEIHQHSENVSGNENKNEGENEMLANNNEESDNNGNDKDDECDKTENEDTTMQESTADRESNTSSDQVNQVKEEKQNESNNKDLGKQEDNIEQSQDIQTSDIKKCLEIDMLQIDKSKDPEISDVKKCQDTEMLDSDKIQDAGLMDSEKYQDAGMSEDLIENLLKDDTCDANDTVVSVNDIPDLEDA